MCKKKPGSVTHSHQPPSQHRQGINFFFYWNSCCCFFICFLIYLNPILDGFSALGTLGLNRYAPFALWDAELSHPTRLREINVWSACRCSITSKWHMFRTNPIQNRVNPVPDAIFTCCLTPNCVRSFGPRPHQERGWKRSLFFLFSLSLSNSLLLQIRKFLHLLSHPSSHHLEATLSLLIQRKLTTNNPW